ncbi:DNA polymerase delta subunit 4-like [Zingiber officinale]|nr:DNA polymerase delta subunit 4-like [Zingiber officinale]XP_042470115.1 DNA polymerase delta subunit 4-like [Zingiber officinale]
MAPSGVKNFYRQKKKGGVAKPSSKRSIAGKSPVPSPFHGSDAERDKAYLAAGIGEGDDEKLRQFDMDMRYGPGIGLSRMDRWERADAMGLNPPAEVEAILLKSSAAAAGCLWDARI